MWFLPFVEGPTAYVFEGTGSILVINLSKYIREEKRTCSLGEPFGILLVASPTTIRG